MRRAIVVPAILAGAALDELKQWLAITTPGEDQLLSGLLRAALDMCEAFTGTMPLAAVCEEVLPARSGWQQLQTRPVQAITRLDAVLADGSRNALAADGYLVDLAADGAGRVRVDRIGEPAHVAVRFTVGLAAQWEDLPEGMRHGALRLAAHLYRERDADAPQPVPPAAVAALWRPWRQLRLA